MEKKTKIYAEFIEETAMDQFDDAMKQDFVVAGALMPDVHTGYSLPIGAVVATKGVVVPAWVGYDIGCGMCAAKLVGVSKEDIESHSYDIFKALYECIPVGCHVNDNPTSCHLNGLTEHGKTIAIKKKYDRAIGSLGGGNHFIEIGYDDSVWVVIHSGSRGVGHGIASYYMTLAYADSRKFEDEFDEKNEDFLKHNPGHYDKAKAKYVAKEIGKLKPKEGHYGFDVEAQNGKDYVADLKWCLDYAEFNRHVILERVVETISQIIHPDVCYSAIINRNHNHAVERDGLWIHRKGATHAEVGMFGVIPGNMRDGSFIVKGMGNPESLYSSSHGAGRVMGRKQAHRTLDVNEFKRMMKDVTALVDDSTLDESPLAYKDIFKVMELQSDLVDIVTHIKPLINIKG